MTLKYLQNNPFYKPPGSIKVGFQEIVERPHVQLLGKQNMVGNVLHYLAHECQTTFNPW